MKYKHTGRMPSGSVVNKDSAWLDSNDGLLISGVAGKSVVICDVLMSTGSGKKLGTSANGGGTLIAYVSSGGQSIRTPIKVEEGESVYTDASASVTVTYYLDELSGSPVSIPSGTTTTPSGVVTNFYFALASSNFPEESDLQNNIHTVVVQRNTTIAGASVKVLTGAMGDTAVGSIYGHIDDDYTYVDTTITFGAGVTSQNISIPIEGDTLVENDEFFSVNLHTPVQTGGTGVITGTNPHIVNILNDDPAPTSTLCITGATHDDNYAGQVGYINGGYAKEVALEAGKVQYKRAGDALDDMGWVFWTTWGGGYWVVAHENSGSYSWAYQSAEDVATPYDVSTWSLASGASGQGWGGTLGVDSGDCPAATTTTTTTTAAPATTTTTTTTQAP